MFLSIYYILFIAVRTTTLDITITATFCGRWKSRVFWRSMFPIITRRAVNRHNGPHKISIAKEGAIPHRGSWEEISSERGLLPSRASERSCPTPFQLPRVCCYRFTGRSYSFYVPAPLSLKLYIAEKVASSSFKGKSSTANQLLVTKWRRRKI